MGEGTPTILIYIVFILFNKKALKERLPEDTKRTSQVGLWKLQGPQSLKASLSLLRKCPLQWPYFCWTAKTRFGNLPSVHSFAINYDLCNLR